MTKPIDVRPSTQFFGTKNSAKRALKTWVAEHQSLSGRWWQVEGTIRNDHVDYMVSIRGCITFAHVRRNCWGKGWLLHLPGYEMRKLQKEDKKCLTTGSGHVRCHAR